MKKLLLSCLLLIPFYFLRASTIDEVEPNNSVASANSITPVFNNLVALDTLKGEINPINDTDFVSLTLPVGYNYRISAFAKDGDNDSQHYSCDIKFSIKVGAGEWSPFIDVSTNGIITTPTEVNVRITGYSTSSTGTYSLIFKIERTTDNYVKVYGLDSESSYGLSSLKNDTAINVECTGSWTATSSEPSWLTINEPSGSGKGRLKFTVGASTVLTNRSAQIVVQSGSASSTFYIYQDRFIALDNYETNDEESKASALLAIFDNDIAEVTTQNANFHNRNDVDYYKLKLDTNFSYLIKAGYCDRANNLNDTLVYTGGVASPAKIKLNDSDYKDFTNKLLCKGSDSVTFRMEPSFGGIGSYKLVATIQKIHGDFIMSDEKNIKY
jgi:hypothetical protein